MKTALALLGQILLFVVFLGIFFAGGILGLFHADPFHAPHWFVHQTPAGTAYFVPSGLLLMTILYLVVLVVEAASKRLRTAGRWTTVGFVLALVIGFIARFGFVTPS